MNKHEKLREKTSINIYIDRELIDFVKDNIINVSFSQFVNDCLWERVLFIQELDEVYRRDILNAKD